MNKAIYLDNAATTAVAPDVLEAMKPYFSEKFGNASSLYNLGKEAREAIDKSRETIAQAINAKPEEIIFTSGGTESDNFAIKGIALTYPGKNHIITSVIEHPAVIEVCEALEKQGYTVEYIKVNSEGIVNLDEIEKKINKDTLLVSVMYVNNEIGTIQPIEQIAKICKQRGIFFHTDAVQGFGKLNIDVKKQDIDLLSASAHKINGPKGIGFLYVKNGIRIEPLINGGGQENEKRSGTENTASIVGFAKATELAEKTYKANKDKIKNLRDKLLEKILKIKGTKLNGPKSEDKRIYNNINVSFKGIEGESLVLMLDKKSISASTGSACSTRSLKPSHVLKAIGLSDIDAHGSLRLTFGDLQDFNEKDTNYVFNAVKQSVEQLRRISPFK